MTPATEAAEAGSAEDALVPGQHLVGLQDLVVGDHVDEPPDSSRAASACFQLAGLPMRMAVAMVSGCSIGWPRTIGAAPAAWKPIILGR